jgi:hypothetical protein
MAEFKEAVVLLDVEPRLDLFEAAADRARSALANRYSTCSLYAHRMQGRYRDPQCPDCLYWQSTDHTIATSLVRMMLNLKAMVK